jgi:hypothetical protein
MKPTTPIEQHGCGTAHPCRYDSRAVGGVLLCWEICLNWALPLSNNIKILLNRLSMQGEILFLYGITHVTLPKVHTDMPI